MTESVSSHDFTLYVAGIKPASRRAVANLRSFCKNHLMVPYTILVVDVAEQPQAARANNIVAVPTLIRTNPLPRLILIGDLSQTEILISRLTQGEA